MSVVIVSVLIRILDNVLIELPVIILLNRVPDKEVVMALIVVGIE